MKGLFQTEFIISIFSLLIAFIFVHTIYVAVIRPNAESFLAEEKASMEADKNYVARRSPYIVVRDFEQETCFVLMFWAFAILGYKTMRTYRQQQHLDRDFVGATKGSTITLSNADLIVQRVQHLPEREKEYLLPRVLQSAAELFLSTRSIQAASTEVLNLCEEESDRMESELSIIRYIAWAIPSVGFIGTVRGIGNALAQAHLAVEGDITGVTQNLGVAFNSTFIALLISIVLMFVIHQIQQMQERLVLNTQRYCSKWLINRLTVDN